jgi:hypothetical protein
VQRLGSVDPVAATASARLADSKSRRVHPNIRFQIGPTFRWRGPKWLNWGRFDPFTCVAFERPESARTRRPTRGSVESTHRPFARRALMAAPPSPLQPSGSDRHEPNANVTKLMAGPPTPPPAGHGAAGGAQAHGREDVSCGIGRERRKASASFLQELLG